MDEPTELEALERRRRNLAAVARRHVDRRHPSSTPAKASPNDKSLRRRLAFLGPVGILLVVVLSKAKLILPLLKFAKVGTLASMFLSIWVYAQFWGLPFAAGFVLLIFVHELGHAIVLRQQGIHAGAPVFIPFVGAVIAMKGMPRNAWVEALVGIGGPVLGSVGAAVCFAIGGLTGAPFWFALAYVGFMLNLFNLIPISPLDGGRIVGVVSRWLWLAGYAVGITVFLVTRSPMLFLVLLLGLFGLGTTIRGHRPGYFDVEPRRRVAMGLAYFGLIALLVIGMWLTHRPLPGAEPGAS